jgi:uncharacterized protein (TIGR02300 family)
VARAEWGTKRTCQACSARFYDLRRDPIVCPVCSAVHDPERQPKPRRAGPSVKDDAPAPRRSSGRVEAVGPGEEVAETDAADIDVDELDDADSGESSDDDLATENGELMEDTSELGEDDDDIGEVMEHIDDENDDKP